jgi:hypothetical protein
MTDISISAAASIGSVRETENHPLKTIVIFSCVGLMVSFGLMTFGINLGAGWI